MMNNTPIRVLVVDHVYMGSLGHTPTAHYKAMFITGYEEDEEHAPNREQSKADASP